MCDIIEKKRTRTYVRLYITYLKFITNNFYKPQKKYIIKDYIIIEKAWNKTYIYGTVHYMNNITWKKLSFYILYILYAMNNIRVYINIYKYNNIYMVYIHFLDHYNMNDDEMSTLSTYTT